MWNISPLREMWGIGRRVEKTLNGMGIFTVGQLARYDLAKLEKKFGIMGNQLYHHAWGIDLSEIGAPIMAGQISFGKSQILLRDYKEEKEIKHVVLEMCEEVARRARSHRKAGRTISFGLGYSQDEFGGGFTAPGQLISQPILRWIFIGSASSFLTRIMRGKQYGRFPFPSAILRMTAKCS